MRDAQLLNQAITDSVGRKDRDELLISRLVRYHWDKPHLMQVKQEFLRRYGKELESAIKAGCGSGNYREFMLELCRGAGSG
jgi:Annexin